MERSFSLIKQLVEDFKANEAAFLASSYQESQVRLDFIDKFFTALGWDVSHQQQKNPYEQEVRVENRVKMDGSQRYADYAFFAAPNFRDVKFFAEAKKPAHDLATPAYYHQTVRYGWNAKTPIAILTDFEELHLLDCRYKPDLKTALSRKIEVFRYIDYADEEIFKRIFFLIGRNAVAGGSLEKFAASLPKPRGKAIQKSLFKGGYKPVDEDFLDLLDEFRTTLASTFKHNNPSLDSETLTEAVQRTIDRLVFIRFLEDKGIEDPMMVDFRYQPSAWNAFQRYCWYLEPKYNGLVFKKHPTIDATQFIPPDDDTFADICDELADPTSPYDFNAIPISILGSIYERFLGKVVVATAKRARVEEKPEVRKAGGVYYTPDYIVRYIVQETVGKLLYETLSPFRRTSSPEHPSPNGRGDGGEGEAPGVAAGFTPELSESAPMKGAATGQTPEFRLTPAEVAKLRIIDIACGSGSFLLEVYNQLLDYHLRYYTAHPEAAKKGDTATRDGKLTLSHKKRKEILVNNIYGVDIDFQATEVTQLSLYLKLMEDVTLNDSHQFSLLKEKMLPELKRNIVCGNSLIGRDILEGKLFDEKADHDLKPMNFEDAFPEIMKSGGFDAVVGNPPYVRQEDLGRTKSYLENHYESYRSTADLYVHFIEKGINLLQQDGLFGMIVSNKWLKAAYGDRLRSFLLKKATVHQIIDLAGLPVFVNATVRTIVLICSSQQIRSEPTKYLAPLQMEEFHSIRSGTDLKQIVLEKGRMISLPNSSNEGWSFAETGRINVISKLRSSAVVLTNYVDGKMFRGIITGYNKAFMIDRITRDKLISIRAENQEIIRPLIVGKDVGRYHIDFKERYLIWTYVGVPIKRYPEVLDHLTQFKAALQKRWDQGDKWWELRHCDYYDRFAQPKIIYPDISTSCRFTIDSNGFFSSNTTYFVPGNDFYLLGLLNSQVGKFYFNEVCAGLEGGGTIYLRFFGQYLQGFPVHMINENDPADKARHDCIVSLVEQMLKAKEKQASAKTESEKNRLDIQIESLDRQIDAAVYELYGLTEEEIKIVEGK